MKGVWNNAAAIRESQIESKKDITFWYLFLPLFKSKIKYLKPGNTLEIGSGTGHLAYELSKIGYDIDAIEPSSEMYKYSFKRNYKGRINYFNLSLEEFVSEKKYDFIYSHLVVHVINDFDIFLKKVKILSKPGGNILISIPHPCFYNSYKEMFCANKYEYMKRINTRFDLKITCDQENVIIKIPYYHRPLSYYFNKIIENEFVIKDFCELYPNIEVQKLYGYKWSVPYYCYIVFQS